ncbi:MAG TPA: hypothetical protein VN154_04205 [Rhizomicrobium sp.]|nr:hypothetical protein [Rhizomicrobium sp.]
MRLTQVQLMLVVSVLAASIGVCSPSIAQQSAIERGAAVKNICIQTLEVGQSATDLDACMSSLSESQNLKLQISHDIDIEHHCSTSGHAPGTAAYYGCEVDSEAANPPAEPVMKVNEEFGTPHVRALGAIFHFGATGYYGMSSQTKRLKEEQACAQIGVDPENSGCVANLDAALFNADNPYP